LHRNVIEQQRLLRCAGLHLRHENEERALVARHETFGSPTPVGDPIAALASDACGAASKGKHGAQGGRANACLGCGATRQPLGALIKKTGVPRARLGHTAKLILVIGHARRARAAFVSIGAGAAKGAKSGAAPAAKVAVESGLAAVVETAGRPGRTSRTTYTFGILHVTAKAFLATWRSRRAALALRGHSATQAVSARETRLTDKWPKSPQCAGLARLGQGLTGAFALTWRDATGKVDGASDGVTARDPEPWCLSALALSAEEAWPTGCVFDAPSARIRCDAHSTCAGKTAGVVGASIGTRARLTLLIEA